MNKTDARPERLYLIQLAAVTVPLPNGQSMEMSAGCYLVQMSDGQNILIDSGSPEGHSLPGGIPQTGSWPNVLEQLASLHIRPQDINMLICTHFDTDHAGYHDAFADVGLDYSPFDLVEGCSDSPGSRLFWYIPETPAA